jgi:hypothetical protein
MDPPVPPFWFVTPRMRLPLVIRDWRWYPVGRGVQSRTHHRISLCGGPPVRKPEYSGDGRPLQSSATNGVDQLNFQPIHVQTSGLQHDQGSPQIGRLGRRLTVSVCGTRPPPQAGWSRYG